MLQITKYVVNHLIRVFPKQAPLLYIQKNCPNNVFITLMFNPSPSCTYQYPSPLLPCTSVPSKLVHILNPTRIFPNFGSRWSHKVRGYHSFSSCCDPKTEDLTSGSLCDPREWGWPLLIWCMLWSHPMSSPCLCLFTSWSKLRQETTNIATRVHTYVAKFTKKRSQLSPH